MSYPRVERVSHRMLREMLRMTLSEGLSLDLTPQEAQTLSRALAAVARDWRRTDVVYLSPIASDGDFSAAVGAEGLDVEMVEGPHRLDWIDVAELAARLAAGAARTNAPVDGFLSEKGYAPGEVDGRDAQGITPLMRAAYSGPAELVRALLEAGARVDTVNRDGNRPLWLACAGDDPAIVDLIVAAGAELDHANASGFTALMYAASAGKARALERLLAAGADLAIEIDGMTALDMAATLECLQLMRAAGRGTRR
jgi:hypothetical protein